MWSYVSEDYMRQTNLCVELKGRLGVLNTNHRVVKLRGELSTLERWERKERLVP